MNESTSIAVRVALVAVVGMSLGGCSYLREAAGMNKMAPDEFAVLTKAPLVIPPDFGLMPPKPGAAPTNQDDPTTNAETALYGSDTATVAAGMAGSASMGEKLLLAEAGAADADTSIRQKLAADETNTLVTDDSFTEQLLFWQDTKKKPDTGTPVNADAEAKRMDDQQQTGKIAAPPSSGPSPASDEDGSWFDGLFDWF